MPMARARLHLAKGNVATAAGYDDHDGLAEVGRTTADVMSANL